MDGTRQGEGGMGLFPEPRPAPEPPVPGQTAAAGPHGGLSFSYRGARIERLKGGHVCTLLMDGHPPHGRTFGVPGTITPLVDLWVEERRLPANMRMRSARPD